MSLIDPHRTAAFGGHCKSRVGSGRPGIALRRNRRKLFRLQIEQLEDRRLLAGDFDPLRSRSDEDPIEFLVGNAGSRTAAAVMAPTPGKADVAAGNSDSAIVVASPSDAVAVRSPNLSELQSGQADWFATSEPLGHDSAIEAETWIVRVRDESLTSEIGVSNIVTLLGNPQLPASPWFRVVRGLGMPGLILVEIDRAHRTEATAALQANSHIEYFEQNFEIRAQETIPDDTEFPNQLYLDNPSSYDIAATSVWDTTTGSRENVVAVLDSGMDYAHPDLYSNVWINAGEIPVALDVVDVDLDGIVSFVDLNQPENAGFVVDHNGNGFVDADDLLSDPAWMDNVDSDGNHFVDDLFGWNFVANDPAPQDDNGHGTHVSGVIAAAGNNAIGVAGVSWQSSVMVLKFLDQNNSGDVKDAILAANYINMMRRDFGINVRVVNNSWVSLEGASEALYQAFRESGVLDILVVASAGNGNVFRQPNDNDQAGFAAFPASFDLDNIISVTATDSKGDRVPYFNYGLETVDLAAPGLNILSTEPGGGYGLRSGTSFAAPQVSAAALLVWANTPRATASEVRAAVLQGVELDDTLTGRVSTGGRMNLSLALGSDTIAPRAELVQASHVKQRDIPELTVSVRLSDEVGLDLSTIDVNDIELRRVGIPETILRPLSRVVTTNPDSRLVDVTYTFAAPGGVWEEQDNGDYAVYLRAGETFDVSGNLLRPLTRDPEDMLRLDTTPLTIDVPAPGTIVVTRFDDTLSSGSLRAAVIEANQAAGENTILLDEGSYDLTIPGTLESLARAGDLDVRDTSGSLTIIGQGPDKTVINAGGIDRIFDVKPGVTLVLKNVRVIGGDNVNWGGGIRNDNGILTIIGSRFDGNNADYGGGVYSIGGTLVIEGSEIDGNHAFEGGGIYLYDGSATLINARVAENTADRFGGGVNNFDGALEIRDSEILQNNAGAGGSGSGGGIETLGDFTLINSEVRGNTVLVDGVVSEIEPNNSVAQAQNLNDSKWNTAPDPDIGSTAESIPHVTILGTGDGTFDYYSFTVADGDRGIFDIDYGAGGDGAIDTELFLFNEVGDLIAQNDDAPTSAGGEGSLANTDAFIDHMFDAPGSYFLAVGRFDSEGAGGVVTGNAPASGQTYTLQISLSNKDSFALGGGIYIGASLPSETIARIENSRILENSANAGGGIFNDEGGKLTVVDSTVSDNAAVTIVQVGLLETDEYTAGGGIFTSDDATILRSLISANNAGVGGGIDINAIETITVNIIESTIAENVAKSDEYAGGGGIRNGNAGEGGGTLIIRDSTIRDNQSTFEGGGVTNSGTLQMYRSTVSGNLAGNAGGIGNWGIANIDHSTISGNRASSEFDPIEIPSLFLFYRTGDGGGIYNSSIVVAPFIDFGSGAEMTITNSTVTNNTADIDGGGIYVAGPDTFSANSIYENNFDGQGDAEDVFAGSHLSDLFGSGLGGRFLSNGHNLIGAGFYRVDGSVPEGEIRLVASDRLGIDAKLGPLTDNGGLTLTHLPQPQSPAIDSGTPGLASPDQRGIDRPQDGDRDGTPAADVGAVERFFGELSGVSFNDVNSNFTQDPGEPGLADWTVYLDLNDDGRWDSPEPMAITDSDGAYLFRQVLPGNYTLRQIRPRLWEQTFPTSRTVLQAEPNDTLATAMSLETLDWTTNPDPNIGDALGNTSESIPHVSLQGFGDGSFDYYSFSIDSGNVRGVFDIDYGSGGDGSLDTELFLFDSNGALLAENDDTSASIGGAGSSSSGDSYLDFIFSDPGVYVIGVGEFSSSAQAGQITGNAPDDGDRYVLQVSIEGHAIAIQDPTASEVAHQVNVGVGQVLADLDFGNHADAGEIRGQVYNDIDGGGIKDDGELGVPNWKLFLDLDRDQVLDEGLEPVAMTDSDGGFVFANVPPGDYQVEQQLTSGWMRTAPLASNVLLADFSDGASADPDGFTAQTDWHLTDARSGDVGHSAAHSFHFGIDTTDGQKYQVGVDGRITSPWLDLTAISGTVILEFNQVLDLSDAETASVVVITEDGETVLADTQSIGGLEPSGDAFEPARLDVSAFIGERIRIAFDVRGDSTAQRTESVEADLTAGETYFLKVESIAGQTAPEYDLSIEAQGAPPDRFESNDDFAAATDLGIVDVRIESGLSIDPLSGNSSSPDFFQFSPASSGVLRATIEFEHSFGDLDFYLYNSEMEVVSASLSISDRESVAASVNEGEIYFLEVRGYRGATNPAYDLLIDAAGIAADGFEENDTSGQASPLGTLVDRVERRLSIEAGDEDWFQFQVVQSGPTVVGLDFEHQFGDLDLIVYDQNLLEISRSESTTDGESVSFLATAGQAVFIQVFEFNGGSHPNYDLIIDSLGIAPDRFEANEDFAAATDLGSLGYRREPGLTIDTPGDNDFFRFVAYESGTADVQVHYDPSRGDVVLSLYDASQNLISTSRGGGWFVDDVSVAALGTYELTVSAGHIIENTDFGNLLLQTGDGAGQDGVIAGYVFEDLNQNRIQDAGESALVGLQVFLDLNRDGTQNANEPTATTDAGGYRFENLGPGTYNVVLNGPSSGVQTWPVANDLIIREDQTTGGIPQSVVLSYLNDDDQLDVAVANEETGNVSVFLSDPSGNFLPRLDIATGGGPFRIVSGEFDDDPGQDLAVANRFANTISILGNRAGSFSPQNVTPIQVGEGPIALAHGHLNEDEYLDLVVARTGSLPGTTGGLSLLFGGPGGFTNQDMSVGGYPISITLGRFDEDDDLDLAVADLGVGAEVGTISIFLNQSGTFILDQTFDAGRLFSITAGDFNGDQRDDIAVADLLGGVTTLTHQPDGSFSASVSNFSAGATSLAAEDFDRDGDIDLAVSTIKPESKGALILRNDQGEFDPQEIIGVGQFGTELAYAVTSALPGGQFGPARTQGPSVAIVKADSNRVVVLDNRLVVVSHSVEVGSSQTRDDVRFGFFAQFLQVDIASNVVAENSADSAASPVGELVVRDIDGVDHTDHTFTLVSGTGDDDNEAFEISGGVLNVVSGTTLNYESRDQYSVRVQATDSGGQTLEAALSIEVVDVNEPPSLRLTPRLWQVSDDVSLSGRLKVADVEVTDDALGDESLALSGDDAGLFELDGSELYLQSDVVLDASTNPLLDVTVSVDDTTVGSTPDDSQSLAVSVTSPILEDSPAQSIIIGGIASQTVGLLPLRVVVESSLLTLIPDPTVDYIDGMTTAAIGFTPAKDASGDAILTVTITDAGTDQVFDTLDDQVSPRSLTITVLPVNDAPSIQIRGNQSVQENSGVQTVANFATGFDPGGGQFESSQTILDFVVENDNHALFSVQPDINNNGVLTYTPAPIADGSATVSVQVRDNGGSLRDGVDFSAILTFVIEITPTPDTMPPMPVIATGASDPTNDVTFDVTIDFGEAVTGFDTSDLMLVNATASNLRDEGEGQYKVAISAMSDGQVSIKVPAMTASDLAGNLSLESAPLTRNVDTTRPVPSLQSLVGSPTNQTAFDVSIDFGEPVSGFESSDLALSSGRVNQLIDLSGGRYTAQVVELADGPFTLTIAAGAGVDAAGNQSLASDVFVRTVDTVAPLGLLTTTEQDPTLNLTFELNIAFGETVTGFTLDDLQVEQGSARDLVDRSNGNFSVTIDAQADQTVRVSLAGGAVQDSAGNANLASDDFTIHVLDPTPKDFGDAPTAIQSGLVSSYPTLRSDNAATHLISDLYLGTTVTSDSDGQPTANADGDMDDGVLFSVTAVAGSTGETISSVVVTASQAGLLDAWIDFNRDGQWQDPDERIAASVSLIAGANVLPFGIPAGTTPGDTFARFRVSTAGGLPPGGPASDGEVEDYSVMLADAATAPELEAVMDASGSVEVVLGESQIQLVSGSNVIAQVSRSDVAGISLLGQDSQVIARAASTLAWRGVISVDLALPDATLTLTGDQTIDVSTLEDASLQGIDAIDLIEGDHQLTLDVLHAQKIARGNRIAVVFDSSDTVVLGEGWQIGAVTLGSNNQLIRQVVQDAFFVDLDGPDDYTNPIDPFDVNRNGEVSANDALNIINELAARRYSQAPQGTVRDVTTVDLGGFRFYDVSRDLRVTALDALRVINELGRRSIVGNPISAGEWVVGVSSDDEDSEQSDPFDHEVSTITPSHGPRSRAVSFETTGVDDRRVPRTTPPIAARRAAEPSDNVESIDAALVSLFSE